MAHVRHWQHDGGVGNSFSYLFGPIVAFLAIGVLVVVLRWAFNSRKTSVVAAAPKAGSQDDSGRLVPGAAPPPYIDGEILRRRLEDAGIKANLANTHDGPRGMVWPKDEQRARQPLIS